MKKVQKLFAIALSLLFIISLAVAQDGHKVVMAQDEAPQNYLYLDATYDPENNSYSVGGLSAAQLKMLGIPELDPSIWDMLEGFESVGLVITDAELNVKTDEADLATINWDVESRDMIYNLVDSYGLRIPNSSKQRVEEYLDKADVSIKLRNSPYLSDTLVLNMDTLLKVDLSKEGKLAVEGFNTGVVLQPEILNYVTTGDIDNATVCLSKGMLFSEINGNKLPKITIHQEGLAIIEKALGIDFGEIEKYFESQIGASISYDGSSHKHVECLEIQD